MCRPHLLGEHMEGHMFQGSMRGNISLAGFYDGNLFFGPQFLIHRHNELTMLLKGQLVGHKTQITTETIAEATGPQAGLVYSRLSYPDIQITKEMVKQSRMDLLSRCSNCRNLHLRRKREGRKFKYPIPSLAPIDINSGGNT